MTRKTKSAAESPGNTETVSLGKPADPAVKASRPQVADGDKLEGAARSVDALADRLAALDRASGPFGGDDIDFRAGRVSGLLDDSAEPAEDTSDAPLSGGIDLEDDPDDAPAPSEIDPLDETGKSTTGGDVGSEVISDSLDDLLDNGGDDAMKDDPTAPPADPTPLAEAEASARADKDYEASVDDFLWEIEKEEGRTDPGKDGDGVPARISPFAALLSPLGDAEFTDDGVPEGRDASESFHGDYTGEDDLFFTGDSDLDLLSWEDEPGTLDEEMSRFGSDRFIDPDFDGEAEDAANNAGDAPDDGSLPTLTMGVDDDLMAPGTTYSDPVEATTWEDENPEDDNADPFTERDAGTEEEDDMAISVQGSGKDAAPDDDTDHESHDEMMDTSTEALHNPESAYDDSDLDAFLDEDDDEAGFTGGDWDRDDFSDQHTHDADEAPRGGESPEAPASQGTVPGNDAAAVLFDDEAPAEDHAETVAPAVDAYPADDPVRDPASREDAGAGSEEAAPASQSSKKKRNTLLATASVFGLVILAGGYMAATGMLPGPGNSAPVVAVEDTVDTTAPLGEPAEVAMSDIGSGTDAPAKADAEPVMEDGDPYMALAGDEAAGDDDITDDLGVIAEDDPDADPVVVPDDSSEAPGEADTETDPGEVSLAELMGTGGTPSDQLSDMADPTLDMTDIPGEEGSDIDPIAALSAELDRSRNRDTAKEDAVAAEAKATASGVAERRVIALEESLEALDTRMAGMADEMAQMNQLIVQTMERTSTMASRVESNERSLRGVSAILSEFAKVQESLDQTQIVLLDIASRVGSLEAADPANAGEVDRAIAELDKEIERLTANMSILARMTVNGVDKLEPAGGRSGGAPARSSAPASGGSGTDTVFANEVGSPAPAEAPTDPAVPSDASPGDFVEGYGYVLDVVPASGDQNLVIMENASILVPK